MLRLLFLSFALISASQISEKQKSSLRTLTIKEPALYAACSTKRDIISFLNYVSSYESHLQVPSVNSLVKMINPSPFDLHNSQILTFIAVKKGLASRHTGRFLLKCLKKSAFNGQVWSAFTSLARMNRVKFLFFLKNLCRKRWRLFLTYVEYEVISIVLSFMLGALPSSIFLALDLTNLFFLFLFIFSGVFYQFFVI